MVRIIFILSTIVMLTNVYGKAPDTVWSRLYGDTDCISNCLDENAIGIVQTKDGGFVLCGNTEQGRFLSVIQKVNMLLTGRTFRKDYITAFLRMYLDRRFQFH